MATGSTHTHTHTHTHTGVQLIIKRECGLPASQALRPCWCADRLAQSFVYKHTAASSAKCRAHQHNREHDDAGTREVPTSRRQRDAHTGTLERRRLGNTTRTEIREGDVWGALKSLESKRGGTIGTAARGFLWGSGRPPEPTSEREMSGEY